MAGRGQRRHRSPGPLQSQLCTPSPRALALPSVASHPCPVDCCWGAVVNLLSFSFSICECMEQTGRVAHTPAYCPFLPHCCHLRPSCWSCSVSSHSCSLTCEWRACCRPGPLWTEISLSSELTDKKGEQTGRQVTIPQAMSPEVALRRGHV